MADGYRNNGLFNIDIDAESVSNKGIYNSQFMYPPNSVRFLEAQDALNKVVAGDFAPYAIQRGYIRNLAQPMMGETPINKCKFQFNPQDIRQSVQMREDMYLAVLQDPVQLSQPIGAQMNFQFDLLFDRQMEVARGDGGSPSQTEIADQIGVMADLKVLYAVIGQGLSEGMVASQLKALQDGATRVYGNSNPATIPDDGDDDETPIAPTFSAYDPLSLQNGNEFLEMNTGNAAFLMPNPVRLMFASLFMLDGFVTATNVDFLKFSTKMVPVTCKVSISMMAVYIGFANKDTFLTKQFQSAKDAEDEAREEDAEGSKELLESLKKSGRSVTFGFCQEVPYQGNPKTNIDNFEKRSSFFEEDATTQLIKYALQKTPSVRGISSGDPFFINDNFVFRFDGIRPGQDIDGYAKDNDAILALYEQDAQFTISYDWECKIYGDKSGASANSGFGTKATADIILWSCAGTTDTLNKGFSESLSRSLEEHPELVLLGSYQGSKSASSKNEWGAGASGDDHSDDNARRLLIRGKRGTKSELTNNAADAPNFNLDGTGYYIVMWRLEVTALVAGLRPRSRPAPEVQYFAKVESSLEKLYINYNLDWSEAAN